jgi:hypothetical protein
MTIENKFPKFFVVVRRKVLYFYAEEIRRPMNKAKLRDIKKFKTNTSYKQVVYLTADFQTEITELVQQDLEKPRNNFNEESE